MPYPVTASPGDDESATSSSILPLRSAQSQRDTHLGGPSRLDRQVGAEVAMDAGAQVDLQREELDLRQSKGKEAVRKGIVPPKGWMHFVAGGVGGMCGAIVTSPLDVVKTRLQSDLFNAKRKVAVGEYRGLLAQSRRLAYHFVETGHILRDIAVKEGPRALFKGLGPTLVGVIPARSINFYTYGNGKLIIADYVNGGRESPAVHLMAASCAGIVTATATNPIWVVKTRLQLESHALEKAAQAGRQAAIRRSTFNKPPSRREAYSTSSRQSIATHAPPSPLKSGPSNSTTTNGNAFAKYFKPGPAPPRPSANSFEMTLRIVKSEGLTGLYKGMSASYLGVAEGTIQWVLYEKLKRQAAPQSNLLTGKPPSRLRQWAGTVGAAGLAKMTASLITYPHEVLRTRLRQAPNPGEPRKYITLLQTCRIVLREEGAAAFYGGLSAHLLRVVPNAAIMFVVYETALTLGNDPPS